MAAILKHKTIYPGFGNSVEFFKFVWDVAAGDAGAAAAYDICTFGAAGIIVAAHARVITTFSTGSSPTLKWGPSADDDRFMTTTQGAAANLTAGAVILPVVVEGTPNVIACPYSMAAAAKLVMTIGTATITAGAIEFTVGVLKP